eukprot:g9121.t1
MFFIATGLAASTRETYRTGMRQRFCGMFNMWEEAFPPSAMPCVAARRTSREHPPANTIFGYVAGLRSFCVDMGLSVAPFSDARVRRVRRAIIKRARSRAPRRRLPITVQLAVKMLGVLLTGKHCTESVMLAAIITTGIYALLRSGEMVVKADSSSAPLRREHVQWDSEVPPQWVDIFIEASKTDFCREGATLRLHRNESISCPFTRLQVAWNAAPNKLPWAPLFQSASGQPLSYSWLQSSLRRLVCEVGLDPALYGSHSLRIGGTTSLAMIPGVTADIIKHMGRWRSLSYQLYVRVTNEAVCTASASLGRLGDAPRSQHRNAAGSASLFGGLAMESALQLSSDDIDDIVVRFQGQGGA